MGLRSGQDQNPTRVPPPSRFWFVPFEKSHNKASHLGAKIKERSEDPMREKRVGLSSNREDGEFRRVLIPVIYFNHPLFSDLLREAEKKFGFEHPGGITIPCRLTEFERVKTRIASGSGQRGGVAATLLRTRRVVNCDDTTITSYGE
ncbi:Auxin-induced protein X10A [Glycine soja]|uniref:Auxin-induced protein X10A n=1 Tax=Glycine soja TaxID=3848 RepID=A0A0B2SSN7_GLYSO|nr:Auxin-induced protein X10A [Glycine soja]